jgi:hypothetical protein
LKRVVRSRGELEQEIAADSTAVIPQFHIWFGEQVGVAWDKESSWNNRHGIPNTDIATIAKRVLGGQA